VTARRPSAKESLSDDLFQLFMDEFVTLKTSPSIRDSDRMRRIHESFDTENEGSVSISGLEQMLHAMKEQSVSKKVVLQLLEDFDTDKSGRIDADEFIAMWSRLQILQLESAFKQVDFDRSGTVDASELKRLMELVLPVADDNIVRATIAEFDDDHSGSLDFDEFKLLWERLSHDIRKAERLNDIARHCTHWQQDRADSLWFKCTQVSEIMEHFDDEGEKIELVVIFYARVVDEWNMDAIINMLSEAAIKELMVRLGPFHLFNPFRTENSYELDLSRKDEWTVAKILVEIAVEEPGENWTRTLLNGQEFGLTMYWVDHGPVEKGILEVTFRSGHPNWKFRRECARKYLAWSFHHTREEWDLFVADMTQQHQIHHGNNMTH